jgi:hypothetical protein
MSSGDCRPSMMTKEEYWLLDSVVYTEYPIEFLLDRNIELVFNRAGHGLTPGQLADVLYHLFHRGDMRAKNMARREPHVVLPPTLSEIRSALAGKLYLSYGLTPRGGARWEAYSSPDWNRYIDAGYRSESGGGAGEISAGDRHLIEHNLELIAHVHKISVLSNSERWDIITPWQATYWKTLPNAHRVRFRYTDNEAATLTYDEAKLAEWERLSQWYTPYI